MKKCLVLDLDNTLWGGIIGEDGMEGIKLDPSFIAFQQAILDLVNRGIILAVNSKNNFDDAIKVFREHPNMILKENHIAAWRINWNDKATNIRELAKELNIGLDSMVFLDDDETNRALVRGTVPEVEVPELPKNFSDYAKFLLSLPYFPKIAETDEDKMRTTFYTTELLRKREEQKFNSKVDFLKSLDICMDVFIDNNSCIPRLAQLTEKTNQFNNNKEPLSEADILKYIADPNYVVFHASVRDKFGDNGVIAFAIVKKEENVWIIKSFLMSCRILGKGIEESFLSYIKERADLAVDTLRIEFKTTDKNQLMADFIKKYFDDEFKFKSMSILPLWVDLIRWDPAAHRII